jgi:hypothetical protein
MTSVYEFETKYTIFTNNIYNYYNVIYNNYFTNHKIYVNTFAYKVFIIENYI